MWSFIVLVSCIHKIMFYSFVGVYFRCPMISDEVLTKDEWKVKIKQFLFDQLEEERGLTACLIIHCCNYNRGKVMEEFHM